MHTLSPSGPKVIDTVAAILKTLFLKIRGQITVSREFIQDLGKSLQL